jgi:tRNA 2-thiouridine synthesizing protein A
MKIDVRGEICPYPLKKTLEALARLAPGEDLEVLTDHPPSLEMIRIMASQRGYAMRVEDAGPAEWRITLSQKEGTRA